MKKFLTLTVAILAVSFTSCSKDKDKDSTDARLIGEWALQSQSEAGKEFKEECQEYSYIIFTEKEMEMHVFKDENGVCQDDNKENAKISYTISDNKITVSAGGEKASISYTIKDDILTIVMGGITETYKKNARKTPPPVVIPDPDTNPFVGTWALESYIDNGQDKTTDCERKERVIFTNSTITINGSYVHPSDNSCQSDLTELTYTYTNGKISAKEKKSGEVVDSFITFILENGMLVITQVDDNSKTVIKYKKQ